MNENGELIATFQKPPLSDRVYRWFFPRQFSSIVHDRINDGTYKKQFQEMFGNMNLLIDNPKNI